MIKNNKMSNEKIPNLVAVGLSEGQALIYETLIKQGSCRAHRIAFLTGLSRQLCYKVLDQLKNLGLVEEKIPAGEKVAVFHPTHPSALEFLVKEKQKELEMTENAFNSVISDLVSSYNVLNKKPNIKFFEGLGGISKMYEDVLRTGQDILLLRSHLDQNIPELRDVVAKQIRSQAKKGIRVRAITPLQEPIMREITKEDPQNLVSRRFLKHHDFSLPSQFIVYGEKVAMTSYESNLVTTIIDNRDISGSFRVIFELLWKQGLEPDQVLREI